MHSIVRVFIFAVWWKLAETVSISHQRRSKYFEVLSSVFHKFRHAGNRPEEEFNKTLATEVEGCYFCRSMGNNVSLRSKHRQICHYSFPFDLLIRELSILPTPAKGW